MATVRPRQLAPVGEGETGEELQIKILREVYETLNEEPKTFASLCDPTAREDLMLEYIRQLIVGMESVRPELFTNSLKHAIVSLIRNMIFKAALNPFVESDSDLGNFPQNYFRSLQPSCGFT